MNNNPRPRIVTESGHIRLESSAVKADLFVHETDDGGIYFEIAARDGASFRPRHLRPETSRTGIIYPPVNSGEQPPANSHSQAGDAP